MKVGTDAVLLGVWANAESPHAILDIGTGTGVIALMLAQRFSAARVHAVETDDDACEQAKSNIAESRWANRMKLTHAAVQRFLPSHRFDLIVANPPYFQNSQKSGIPARDRARHNVSLSLEDLASSVVRLLNPAGRFCVIFPIEEGELFCRIAVTHNLYCERICHVLPTPQSRPKRQLMKFSLQQSQEAIVPEELVIEAAHRDYSQAFRLLARAFLLKL